MDEEVAPGSTLFSCPWRRGAGGREGTGEVSIFGKPVGAPPRGQALRCSRVLAVGPWLGGIRAQPCSQHYPGFSQLAHCCD